MTMTGPRNHRPEPQTGSRFDRDRVIGALVWICVGAWGAFALVRLFGLEWGFPLTPLLAFTPWVAAASVVPIGLAGALRRWRALAVAVVAAGVLVALVLPRAFGGATRAEGGAGAGFRVLAVNVEFGEADAQDLIALAGELDADALVVAELTPRFTGHLRRAGVRELFPHSVLAAKPRADGTGIYSRLRLSGTPGEYLPGGFTLTRARLAPADAQAIEPVAVHAAPPIESGTAAWEEDLEELPSPSATPTVLAGDFNATLDHASFREVLDRGYADAAATLGEGLTPTWPTDRRLPPMVAIDHVLADERLGIRDFSAHDVAGTDHRAVFAELELPAPGG